MADIVKLAPVATAAEAPVDDRTASVLEHLGMIRDRVREGHHAAILCIEVFKNGAQRTSWDFAGLPSLVLTGAAAQLLADFTAGGKPVSPTYKSPNDDGFEEVDTAENTIVPGSSIFESDE